MNIDAQRVEHTTGTRHDDVTDPTGHPRSAAFLPILAVYSRERSAGNTALQNIHIT